MVSLIIIVNQPFINGTDCNVPRSPYSFFAERYLIKPVQYRFMDTARNYLLCPFFLKVRAGWEPDAFPVHYVLVLIYLVLINARVRRYVTDFTQNLVLSRLVSFKVLSIERYPGVSRCGHPDVTSPLTSCEVIQLVSDENASVCGRSGSGRVCVSPCKRAVRAAYECV